MGCRFVIGFGLASVISSSPAFAQFAADRQPPNAPGSPVTTPSSVQLPVSPTSPGGLPAGGLPGGTVPPSRSTLPPPSGAIPGGLQPVPATSVPQLPRTDAAPASVEIPTALGPDHPWAVKPEHGPYFICVKSYSRPSRPTPQDNGPSARALAEALAADIRETYRVQAFLFEYISEERKAEAAAIAAARERGRLFAEQLEKLKQQSKLQGMEFLEPDTKIHYKSVNYRDQIAVLVGGFQSDEDARKALDKVRTWPPPKDKRLMDGAAVLRPGPDGKPVLEEAYLNPYLTATVVPNPTIRRNPQPATETGLDPFIVKLNEDRPYSLLKATKSWTLAVKSFSAPVQLVSANSEPSAMRKFGAGNGADVLRAGAEQAESLAKTLREMKAPGKPNGFEAFVLHTRTGSIVTVGQFDGPNDPDLIQTRHLLTSMKLQVTEDERGTKPVTNTPSLFGNIFPIPIPKR
jgi:hypothetical protein